MSFKATLLGESFGTNLTNKLRSNTTFISGVSNKVPLVFVCFRAFLALIFIGTCKTDNIT